MDNKKYFDKPSNKMSDNIKYWKNMIDNDIKFKIITNQKKENINFKIFEYLSYELIIFTNNNNFKDIDNFIEKKEKFDYLITLEGAKKLIKIYENTKKENFDINQYIHKEYHKVKFLKPIFLGVKTKLLVISLERAKDRRNNIINYFKNSNIFDLIIIDGIDAKKADVDNTKYDSMSNKGTVFCRLSHMKAIQYIIDNNLDYANIIEDDTKLVSNINENDIDNLDITNYEMIWNNQIVRKKKDKIHPYHQSASSYILSNSGAKKLINLFYTYNLDNIYKICYVDAIMMLWCNENELKWNIINAWFGLEEDYSSKSLIHST